MDDWLERYAAALGVTPLTAEETEALLGLARQVAHGAQRRDAPLSTFLAGVLAGSSGDASRPEGVERSVATAKRLLEDVEE